jgi:heat shock protein HspQ
MGDVVPFPVDRARFHIGQLIQHRLFGYRGVIVDVDREFSGSEAWYAQMARSRPPKDQPWYHVLVHGATHQTYVAERNLERDASPGPVEHPMVEHFLEGFDGRGYRPRGARN